MISIQSIVGFASDHELGHRLHKLEHRDLVEYLVLDREDMSRRRLRKATDKGTDCAVSLSREERLGNGAVLLVSDDLAIVVRAAEEAWLTLRAPTVAAALELGYFAGNMHWRVAFDREHIKVALNGAPETYLKRLEPLLAKNRVEVVENA